MPDDAVALTKPDERYESREITLTHEQVERINRETQQKIRALGDIRIHVAFFRCGWPCPKATYEKVRKTAIDRWVRYMERTGWVLVSTPKTRLDKRRMAHRLVGDWYSVPSFDEVEIPVAAAFKKLDMKIQRTEVPVRE